MSRKNLLFTCTNQNRCITCTNLSRPHLLHIDLDYFNIWLFFSCLLIYSILQPAFILIGDCCRIVRSVRNLSCIFQSPPSGRLHPLTIAKARSTEFSFFFSDFFSSPFIFFLSHPAYSMNFSIFIIGHRVKAAYCHAFRACWENRILHREALVCLFNYKQHHRQPSNTLAAREHLVGHVLDCPNTSAH